MSHAHLVFTLSLRTPPPPHALGRAVPRTLCSWNTALLYVNRAASNTKHTFCVHFFFSHPCSGVPLHFTYKTQVQWNNYGEFQRQHQGIESSTGSCVTDRMGSVPVKPAPKLYGTVVRTRRQRKEVKAMVNIGINEQTRLGWLWDFRILRRWFSSPFLQTCSKPEATCGALTLLLSTVFFLSQADQKRICDKVQSVLYGSADGRLVKEVCVSLFHSSQNLNLENSVLGRAWHKCCPH